MDLPDRDRRERELAVVLMGALRPLRRDITGGRYEQHDWEKTQADIADAVKRSIADTYQTMALAVFLLIAGEESDAVDWSQRAGSWAAERARFVSQSFVDNLRQSLGTDPSVDVVTPNRVENVSVTETTNAYGEGVVAGRDEGEKYGKIKVTLAWDTARDSRVCPICAPLHDKLEKDWRGMFPTGPPAHPRCRCQLVPVFPRSNN